MDATGPVPVVKAFVNYSEATSPLFSLVRRDGGELVIASASAPDKVKSRRPDGLVPPAAPAGRRRVAPIRIPIPKESGSGSLTGQIDEKTYTPLDEGAPHLTR